MYNRVQDLEPFLGALLCWTGHAPGVRSDALCIGHLYQVLPTHMGNMCNMGNMTTHTCFSGISHAPQPKCRGHSTLKFSGTPTWFDTKQPKFT